LHSLRSLEELQLKTSDITDILPKRMADFVEQEARRVRYGRQLLRMNRQLLNQKGRSVHLPSRGTLSAVRVSEAFEPTESNASWSTTEVTPFKLGANIHITQESIDGTEIDIINGSIEEAGIALAVREDDEIFHEMLGRRPAPSATLGIWTWTAQADNFSGDGSTTKFTLSQSPVIEMSTVTVNAVASTAFTVDYYDGEINFTAAPTSGHAIVVNYWYSNRTNYQRANTAASFKYEDIIAAKTTIRSQKIQADVLVVNPDEYADILLDSRFVDSSQYGSREPILNGEVGQIAGLKVLVTTAIPSGTALFLATSRAGWYVLKRNIDVKRKESQETDSYKFYFYFEFAPKITDENAVVVSVNHASNAADIA
jgi:N4-gp56 family major capsid protein